MDRVHHWTPAKPVHHLPLDSQGITIGTKGTVLANQMVQETLFLEHIYVEASYVTIHIKYRT